MLALSAPVHAAPLEAVRSAAAHAELGKRYYKESRYDEAISAFQTAYDLDPNPSLLFNIAQAHRRRGDLENAIAAFQMYLARSPGSDQRALVETRLREMQEQLAAKHDQASLPPAAETSAAPVAETAAPAGTPPAPAVATGNYDLVPLEPDAIVAEIAAARRPAPRGELRLLAQAGLAVPQRSGPIEAVRGPFFAGMLAAAYAVPWSQGELDVGLASSWSRLEYRTSANAGTPASTQHSLLVGGFITAAARLAVGRRFSIGPALALGVMWWTGLVTGNPFTTNAQDAVPMPSLRLGLPATWRVGSLVLGLEPALALSSTSGELSETVPSLRWLALSGIVGMQL
jgi:hypothetical protein